MFIPYLIIFIIAVLMSLYYALTKSLFSWYITVGLMASEEGIFSCLFMFVSLHWDLSILSCDICDFVGGDIRS